MPQPQLLAAVVIFAATYAVIAFARLPGLRLDRPGAAVCGAALMVVFGVLSFEQAWAAVDSRTIVLLLGMMILNVLLEDSGFFELAAARVLSGSRSPRQLLAGLTILSGVLSALFLNDTVCLMLTVPVLAIVRRAGLPSVPFLMALAMGANVGSVMTVIGNPQNMLIGVYSGWTYGQFLLWMAPVGAVGLAALVVMLLWFYGERLQGDELLRVNDAAIEIAADEPKINRPLLIKSLAVLAGVMAAFVLVGNLPVVAIGGAAVLMLIARRPTAQVLARVDWVLLAFFAGLFIVVRGLEGTGLVAEGAARVQPLYGNSLATQIPVFSTLVVLGSNVVSNVPLVVLAREIVPTLIEPELMWLVLAMASTFAGNLTIPGSVATLIVLETARRQPGGRETTIGFWEFSRVGIPVTLVTTVLGALVLAAEHWLVSR
jgi:Na+/H+ antiporter NhaD/arsenite permease-like protein